VIRLVNRGISKMFEVNTMALIDDQPRSADVTAHEGPALVWERGRPARPGTKSPSRLLLS
jgi:hypothetical protein